MIANTIFDSFYILELTGEAANLEAITGKRFGVTDIRIVSNNFPTDLSATIAAQDSLDFFMDNPELDMETVKEECTLNPEFFPSLEPIKLTIEQQNNLDDMQAMAQAKASENQIALVLTRHFDNLGDFVSTRISMESTNFTAKIRVAVNPDDYLREKGNEEEERINHSLQPHREKGVTALIH